MGAIRAHPQETNLKPGNPMIKPDALSPDQDFTTIGEVFNAPLVVVGKTWLPLTELFTWGIMVREAGRQNSKRSLWYRLGVGALKTTVILG